MALTRDVLAIDAAAETARIAQWLRDALPSPLGRRGYVVAMSGGVDSAVCAALAVRAVGPAKVLGLFLPEEDSDPGSLARAAAYAAQLGIEALTIDIAPALRAMGCYAMRDEAIRRLVPAWGEGWRCKIAIAGGIDGGINYFRLVTAAPGEAPTDRRLPHREYLQIVAATNMKQRLRKLHEYTHADRLHYAVLGTPNRLEYDQGFFVKNGDGAADVKPIAHLYKSQVYALAAHLGVPAAITSVPPSTDTYSLPQGQDEFYFALPHAEMDLALWAHGHGRSAADLAAALGIPEARAAAVYADIERKRATTAYLHAQGLVLEPVR